MSFTKKVVTAIVGIIVIGAIIFGVVRGRKDIPAVTVIKTERRAELRATVTASGEVRPIQFQNITSEVQGRIEEIYVKEGDAVKKGTPLVKLDPTALNSSTDAQAAGLQAALSDVQASRTQIIAAQNQLASAQQALATAQYELKTAERELKRTTELVEAGVESKANFDSAKDRLDLARIRASQQEIAVRDAKRAVETAEIAANTSAKRADQQAAVLRGQKTQRDKTLSVAPINGVIAEIPSKVGTFAVAGLSTTPLLTIADMSSINIEVKVDETSIDRVAEGQSARIKVDAFGERELAGKVIQKTPLALGKSQTSGGLSTNINIQEAKEFKVVIQLTEIPDDVRDGLRPGMSATAEITTNTVTNVITVPLQSIVTKRDEATPTPDESTASETKELLKEKAQEGVFVLEDGVARFVAVKTGIRGVSDQEIIEGLAEGQQVITGPSKVLNSLKDGDRVKIQERKESDSK